MRVLPITRAIFAALALTAAPLLAAPAYAKTEQVAAKEHGVPVKEITSPGGVKAWLVSDSTVPMLVLNRGTVAPPDGKAGFSLAPEDDGIAAAEYTLSRERKTALIIEGSDDNGRRASQAFRERCAPESPCSASMGTRVMEDPVGRTGLVVLAFLGAGYSPESGKYKTAIRRGTEYLMARQQAIGDYQTHDLIGGYNRPIALQAYAEAYGLTRDERLRPYVQRGVDFLTQIQNSIGGWRYRVEVQTSDSSVAAWMLFAMAAALVATLVPGFSGAMQSPAPMQRTSLALALPQFTPARNGSQDSWRSVELKRGQTLSDVFKELGIPYNQLVRVMQHPRIKPVLRKLQLSSRHELARWATDRRLI